MLPVAVKAIGNHTDHLFDTPVGVPLEPREWKGA